MRSACNDHEMSLASAICANPRRAGGVLCGVRPDRAFRRMRCPSPRTRAHSSRRRLLQASGSRGGVGRRLAAGCSRRPAPSHAESAVGGTLDYMSWEGYDSPDSLKPGEGATASSSSRPTSRTTTTSRPRSWRCTAARATTSSPTTRATSSSTTSSRSSTPIDEKKIPNLKGMLPFFRSNYRGFWVKDGDAHRRADGLGRARPRLRLRRPRRRRRRTTCCSRSR